MRKVTLTQWDEIETFRNSFKTPADALARLKESSRQASDQFPNLCSPVHEAAENRGQATDRRGRDGKEAGKEQESLLQDVVSRLDDLNGAVRGLGAK